MTRSLGWMDAAACRGTDPNLFFPTGVNPRYVEARRICASCPVRVRCLTDAEEFEQGLTASGRSGMRGGLTPTGRANRSRYADRAGATGVAAARRRKVLELHATGLTAKAIAEHLGCHERTVMRITKPVRDQQQAVAS